MPLTPHDVRRINTEYRLRPRLTPTLARQLMVVSTMRAASWALRLNYGEGLAERVESAIMQAANDQ